MSEAQKTNSLTKYPIVVEAIDFNMFSIIYAVGFEDEAVAEQFGKDETFFFEVHKDVCNKDLFIKTNSLSLDDMRVICTPVNVTPHFYQGILRKTIHNVEEYEPELDAIFLEQDVIGYAIPILRSNGI